MGGYIGARSGTISATVANVQDVTATDTTPEITLKNTTETDADGSRGGKITFKGEQSGGEESTLANIQASHDGSSDDEKGDLIFRTNDGSDGNSPTERLRIDSTGKSTFKDDVGIEGETPTLQMADTNVSNNVMDVSYDEYLTFDIDPNNARGNSALQIKTDGTQRLRMNSDGAMFFCNDFNSSTAGVRLEVDGDSYFTAEGGNGRCIYANRLSSDGTIIELARDGTTRGLIEINNDRLLLRSSGSATGLRFDGGSYTPFYGGGASDNGVDLGFAGGRYKTVFAGTGSINTSDENEKQNVAVLTDTEITAAKAISKLFKTFKWNDAVTEKGDNARTHTGVIAQQVQTAMSDAGLDASKYAFWCSDTWWETKTEVAAVEADEENGIEAQDAYTDTRTYKTKDEAPEGATERTRLGIRYAELLSFIGAATEQRLTSIEARLDALEAE